MSPPRKPRRPKSVRLHDLSAYARRGPNSEGLWYWQAGYHQSRQMITIISGWYTRKGITKALAARIAAGDYRKSTSEDITTIDQLMRLWLGAIKSAPGGSPRTFSAYKARARRVAAAIGDCQIERVGVEEVETLRDGLTRSGFAPLTIRGTMQAFRSAWAWGRARGLTPDRTLPPVSLPKPERARERHTPTAEDMAAVIDASAGWRRLFTLLLWYTGARRGEIASLRWADIDLEAATITLKGKTGKRTVPLQSEALEALREAKSQRPRSVFGVAPATASRHLRLDKACEAAGVKPFTAHGIRRLASTELIGAGVDPKTYEALMGHSFQMGMTTYAQVRSEAVQVAAAKLGRPSRETVIRGPWRGSNEG